MNVTLNRHHQMSLYWKGELIGSIYTTDDLEIEITTIYKNCFKVKYDLLTHNAYLAYYVDAVEILDTDTREVIKRYEGDIE